MRELGDLMSAEIAKVEAELEHDQALERMLAAGRTVHESFDALTERLGFNQPNLLALKSQPDDDPRSLAYIRRATARLEAQHVAGEPLNLDDDDGPWEPDRPPSCDWCGGKGCRFCDGTEPLQPDD